MREREVLNRTATALDQMEGIDIEAMRLRHVAGFEHEEIASRLELSVEDSMRLAQEGLRRVKHAVFGG